MTRVLFLNHAGQMSGAEGSLHALLRQLRRAHPELQSSVALPEAGPFAPLLRAEGFPVSPVALRRIARPANFAEGAAALAHVLRSVPKVRRIIARQRAQIVHSNSSTAHLVGGWAAARARVPAVWHARDLVSLRGIAPFLASRADVVVAISECVAHKLRSDGVPGGKIRVIHNGLDPEEWQPRPDSRLRAALKLPDGAFVFGCPSQLVPWKGHRDFIEAAAQLVQNEGASRTHFIILGGDLWGEHAAYVAQLRALVASHGLQHRFSFVPHQSDNVDALRAFDALVLPARAEPFGRVLIEGMALGKPVIAFASAGPREIVTHEHDGLLVPPDEEHGLPRAMRRVLNEPQLRATLAENARRTVATRFHIAQSAAKIVALYRELRG